MLTVIHTFNGPDQDRLLADIRTGLNTVEHVDGFKFASINQQTNTDDILVFRNGKIAVHLITGCNLSEKIKRLNSQPPKCLKFWKRSIKRIKRRREIRFGGSSFYYMITSFEKILYKDTDLIIQNI